MGKDILCYLQHDILDLSCLYTLGVGKVRVARLLITPDVDLDSVLTLQRNITQIFPLQLL